MSMQSSVTRYSRRHAGGAGAKNMLQLVDLVRLTWQQGGTAAAAGPNRLLLEQRAEHHLLPQQQ
jgi:hypothetical protein